jgi:hypothetical protein
MTCPHCGGDLVPSTFNMHPDVAPWTCWKCRYSWWTTELSNEVRKHWRPEFKDHGEPHTTIWIEMLRKKERKDARLRGASLRHDQIKLVETQHLQTILGREEITDEFRNTVQDEVTARANAST